MDGSLQFEEEIRLVIWDLDETFWSGTLTEGGHSYVQAHHDIVIELAKRGIMSSICSKNDLSVIKPLLQGYGIWDYFVFPSISWDPKGPRIARIVENMQLRPATILFVDDNPMNLKEAKHFVPDLQIADETCIGSILASSRFKGKNDESLSRLAQYKILEQKKADEEEAGGDNHAFLRNSNIRIFFDYDVLGQLDRAIELINRTNQLNFTKKRLPEDMDQARAELTELLSHHQTQAALVRVVDNYGDYGYVGLYVIRRNAEKARLVHFSFSCRTLNMGVETFVYRHIGALNLKIVGEVINDVTQDTTDIDWITVTTSLDDSAGAGNARQFDSIFISGGCDMRAVAHYLGAHTKNLSTTLNNMRHGVMYRPEHNAYAVANLDGLPESLKSDLVKVGYDPDDFTSGLASMTGGNNLTVLSFWMDARQQVFRHKATGILVPFPLSGNDSLELAMAAKDSQVLRDIRAALDDAFELVGFTPDDEFESNVRRLADHGAKHGVVYLVKGNVGSSETNAQKARHNKILDKIAGDTKNVVSVNIKDFVVDKSEIHSQNHFDRMVYYRLYRSMVDSTAQD